MPPTAISQNGATDTVYIQDTGTIQYKVNNGSWTTISAWPVTINNTSLTTVLKVLFLTDITLDNISKYFSCTSNLIQFGSTSLEANGSRPTITIEADNYDGFIENGGEATSGYNNIYVYNLNVYGAAYTTQVGGGWLCKKGFGNSSINNYIVNCSAAGVLPGGAVGSGGIVGAYAGKGGVLYIRGCSSTVSIGQLDGGIVGSYAGQSSGSVICEQCFTTGTIGDFGGGIFGDYAGDGGYAEATKCYTTGAIGGNAGGIFSRYAGNNGQANASGCYSRGSINTDGGGVFGISAASNSGFAVASNSYSSGTITTAGNGIYGTGKRVAGSIANNCYSANDSWSDATANTSLIGVPGSSNVGDAWVKRGVNQPYELNAIGYTPYTTTNINSSSDLIQSFSQTIEAGQTSASAAYVNTDPSGNDFTILLKVGGDASSYSTITMNSQTGGVSTTSETIPGTYVLTVRSIGSYNITTFTLILINATANSSTEEVSCCSRPLVVKNVDYTTLNHLLAGNIMIGSTVKPRQPISYQDIYNKKMAYASKS